MGRRLRIRALMILALCLIAAPEPVQAGIGIVGGGLECFRAYAKIGKPAPDTSKLPPKKTEIKYETVRMSLLRLFHIKDNVPLLGIGVDYKYGPFREEFRIYVKDGLFYDSKGNKFGEPHGRFAMFVMDRHGNFYASFAGAPWENLHHSTFLAGGRVAAAGRMIVVDGKLLYMDRESGHYLPELLHLNQAIRELNQDGIPQGSFVVNTSFEDDHFLE